MLDSCIGKARLKIKTLNQGGFWQASRKVPCETGCSSEDCGTSDWLARWQRYLSLTVFSVLSEELSVRLASVQTKFQFFDCGFGKDAVGLLQLFSNDQIMALIKAARLWLKSQM